MGIKLPDVPLSEPFLIHPFLLPSLCVAWAVFEMLQSWVGTCLGLVVVVWGWGEQEEDKGGGVQLSCLSAGPSESHCPGLVDGQGQPGVNLFTAARLGGCT